MSAFKRAYTNSISCPFFFHRIFRLKNAGCKRIFRFYSAPPITAGKKLLFPGQGSQYVGMTTRLQPLCASAEEIFSVASSVLGYDLKHLCINGPSEQLQSTGHCQPAVVVASLVALEQMKHKDPMVMSGCASMAGFSVGEITSLIASKAVPLDKGLELVKLRAASMQTACEEIRSGMVTIIGLEEHTVVDICHQAEKQTGGVASIANYIFPRGMVISASIAALDVVRAKAAECDGASVKPVCVSGGFHSSLMSSAVSKMRELLTTIDFKLPSYPIYSNVTGSPYPVNDPSAVKELLTQQIIKPVKWVQSVCHMIENFGPEGFIEIGPGKQLKLMLKRINRDSFRKATNLEA